MDRETQFATELQALRVLCDQAIPREDRQRLMQALSHHPVIDPEHQVVFESIHALSSRGSLSAGQLRIHLNNRGFPDTDIEKYFQSVQAGDFELRPPDKITP